MFADSIIQSNFLLLTVALIWIVYWRFLGAALDARIFLTLNFSLITVWSFSSNNGYLLRIMALLFIVLLVFAYKITSTRSMTMYIDRILDIDVSFFVIIISCAAILTNLTSNITKIDDKSISLLELTSNKNLRYFGYLLAVGPWMAAQMICVTATQPKWLKRQKIALILALLAAATALSKASFLPILLTLIFVYGRRLGLLRSLTLMIGGALLTLFLVQRMYDEKSLIDVLEIFLTRIINNMDVLNYIEELGVDVSSEYPHASPLYPLWPFYQLSQNDFIVPGVWLHGTLYNDWRGFGPNPTFIGDLLVATNYAGLIMGPIFGFLLKVSDKSIYRVFLAMICFNFLQDWYAACLYTILYCILIFTAKLIVKSKHLSVNLFKVRIK